MADTPEMIPQGATIGEPEQQASAEAIPQGATIGDNVHSGASQFVLEHGSNIGENFAKGAEGTAAGLGHLADRVGHALGVDKAAAYLMGGKEATDNPVFEGKYNPNVTNPDEGQRAMQEQSESGAGTKADKIIGYGGEALTEFLLGDEALKSLSIADKLTQVGKIHKLIEASPRLMQALKLGTNIGKAATELAPEEAALLKKYPTIARLVGLGMDSVRTGVVGGAQATAKKGDVVEGAKEGLETAVGTGVLGTPFATAGGALEKAGGIPAVMKRVDDFSAGLPSKEEVVNRVKDLINKFHGDMSPEYESGIQKLLRDSKEVTTRLQDSELQKAAINASKIIPGESKLPGGIQDAMENIVPGREKIQPLLDELIKPKEATGNWMSGDNLIELRQKLGKQMRQLPFDDPNRRIMQELQHGVDGTLQDLFTSQGNKASGQEYKELRAGYKQKLDLLNSPVIQKLGTSDPGKAVNDVGQYLMTGGNSAAKVDALRSVIGDSAMDEIGTNILQHVVNDAKDAKGVVDYGKIINQAKTIDKVNDKLFKLQPATWTDLLADASTANSAKKILKTGLVTGGIAGGASTALAHPLATAIAAIGGVAGHGGIKDFLDYVASHPNTWKALGAAGKVADSGAVKTATKTAAYGLTQAVNPDKKQSLKDIYHGTADTLGLTK